jgi:prolyl 4-hydroxylase
MYLNDEDILWDEPLIAYVENFMTSSDCDLIIDYAEPLLKRSMVAEKSGDILDGGRTSSEVFISQGQCESNDYHRGVVSEFFGVGEFTFEDSIVINYKEGQEYRPHYDGMGTRTKNRRATAICYLNDVAEGGETIFPKLNISVKPKKGALLYFQYDFGKEIDSYTLHGGSPVIGDNEKWIMTIWMQHAHKQFLH